MIQGKSVGQARDIANELSPFAAPATSAAIAHVLDEQATSGVEVAVTNLLNYQPRPSTVPSKVGNVDVVAPDSATGGPRPIETTAAASSEPKQATDGDPKATSLTTWLLHNNPSTPIFYGDCTPDGCTTGGYFVVDDTASTTGGGPDVTWSSTIKQGFGDIALFSDSTVRMLQDITSEPDPLIRSDSCPVAYGSTKISCVLFRDGPNVTGNWYYYQQNFTACTEIAGCGEIQIQTRRWKVVSSDNYQFIAYQYGG